MRPMFSWKISGWIVKSFSGPVRLVQIVRGPGGDFLHEELLGSAAAQSHGDFVQDGLGLWSGTSVGILWDFSTYIDYRYIIYIYIYIIYIVYIYYIMGSDL